MDTTSAPSKKNRNSLILLAVLGTWLMGLLAVSIWFQNQYVQPFTEEKTFLQADQSQSWYEALADKYPQLAPFKGQKVIQFWQPDCLCNQFARPHALSAQVLSVEMNIPHITLVPLRFADQIQKLQSLNPDTRIVAVDTALLSHVPNAPSLMIENNLGELHYFGPLGFGAFCSQASTSIIDRQLSSLQKPNGQPFFNVIGQGCFCPWQ